MSMPRMIQTFRSKSVQVLQLVAWIVPIFFILYSLAWFLVMAAHVLGWL